MKVTTGFRCDDWRLVKVILGFTLSLLVMFALISGHDTSTQILSITMSPTSVLQRERRPEMLKGEANRAKSPFLFPGLMKFASVVETPQFTCREKRYFGGHQSGGDGVPDGAKAVCLAPVFGITPGRCIVYSFGIAKDWSFDDAMAEFGCQVFSFDPTIGLENHRRSERIQFFNLGLGDSHRTAVIAGVNVTLMTLGQIIDMLGHTNKTIDYLKLDIEGFEIPVFTQLSEEQHRLSYIKQVGLELHPLHQFHEDIYSLMIMLEYLGFSSFDARRNPHQELWYPHPRFPDVVLSSCYEVAWAHVERII